MMKQCSEYIVMMNMYLDDMLSEELRAELFEHLEQCDGCRRRFDALEKMLSVRGELEQEPPEELHKSIMKYVAADGRVRSKKAVLKKIYMIAAVAAVMVLTLSGTLSKLNRTYLFMPKGASEADQAALENSGGGLYSAMAPPAVGAVQDSHVETDYGYEVNVESEPGDGADLNETKTQSGFEDRAADSGKDEQQRLFTLPRLQTTERYAGYCIATGSGSVVDIFGSENVIEYPELGETYVIIPNDAESLEAAERELEAAGFVLQRNLENVPTADENAENYLLVIFLE